MDKVLTVLNVKNAENRYAKNIGSLFDLMQKAGKECADKINSVLPVKGKNVTVIVGEGNNGGDGFIAASRLLSLGASVTVVALGQPKTESAKAAALDYDGKVIAYTQGVFDTADILVDAVYGIGFHGQLKSEIVEIFDSFNKSKAFKVSIDIPSGLCADSGEENPSSIKADLTIALICYKPCHLLFPAAEHCGKTVLCDLDFPDELFLKDEILGEIIPQPVFTKRLRNTHKGSYGKSFAVTGSLGMAGAAILSLKATIKSGVGIAGIGLDKSIYSPVTSAVPEAVCTILDGDETAVVKPIETADAVLIGCGLSKSEFASKLLKTTLETAKKTLIIDADGLNLLSDCIEWIKQTESALILTPHPTEMARLCGVTTTQIEADRIGYARDFAKKYNCVLVLKGAVTIVASPKGEIYFNLTGNAGMATGGSGDMLSGIILSLSAQGYSPIEAAKTAVYIHGAAGDIAAKKVGEISLMVSDMIDVLPDLFIKFGEKDICENLRH